MKNNFYCYILFFFVSVFTACANDQKQIKLGILSDPHFLSEELMDNGDAVKNYESTTGKMITNVPAILDIVIDDYLNSDIEVLLIPGDMTKDGERQSHIDFVKKFQPLKDKGVKIYVIPGNHDINVPHPVGFKGSQTYPVQNISPNEFTQIYAEFGYDTAISRDSSSLSYVVPIGEDTWLLAIDASLYNLYEDRTISKGIISPSTEQWILEVLAKAKAKNIQVVGMMHHGLVEHFVFQSTFFTDYLVDDWQRLAPLFAENGLKLIFTGHFHANDITEYTSGKGEKIYDIETGSLVAYPFAYRFADLSKKEIQISTKNILSTHQNPILASESKDNLQRIAKAQAISKINSIGISIKESVAQIASSIFIMHLEGDEKLDESLRQSIMKLYKNLDPSESIPLEKFELDLYPSDNNIKITF